MKEDSITVPMMITWRRPDRSPEKARAANDFIIEKIKDEIAALLLPDENDALKVTVGFSADGFSVTFTGPEEIIDKIRKSPNKHRLVKRLEWQTSDFIN